MRRFVIGDIHGCMKSIRTLIELIDPQAEDELVFLGDYVDRGPDSRDVVEQLVDLQQRCRVVPLLGNHEIMMLGAIKGLDPQHWLANGGLATLSSYGGAIEKIPASHIEFLSSLRPFYETEREIFVHACYDATLPMEEQCEELMYWTHLGPFWPPPHRSGKRVFVGHTPQSLGNIMDLGYLVCLDTYCFGQGYLTAMDLDSGDLIQVDYYGHLRRPGRSKLVCWLQAKVSSVSSLIFGRRNAVTESIDLDPADDEEMGKVEDSAQSEQLQRNGVS